MTDKKSNDSRRKLLKSIATGSGAVIAGKSLPESWSKPIVNFVILPAHANTTDDSGSLPTDPTTTPVATTTPCAIAGNYCWNQGNYVTTFAVEANGNITITRVKFNEKTWTGSGFASNGALGGAFDIRTLKNLNPDKARDYTGEVICNGSSILGVYNNPNKSNDGPTDYEAVINSCPSATSE